MVSAWRTFRSLPSWIIPLVLAVVILLLPVMGLDLSTSRQIQLACILALVVSGLNLSLGFAGELALGQAAMYAAGAYTAGLMSQAGHTDILVQLAAAGAVALGVGILTGVPGLRLGNWSLAIYVVLPGAARAGRTGDLRRQDRRPKRPHRYGAADALRLRTRHPAVLHGGCRGDRPLVRGDAQPGGLAPRHRVPHAQAVAGAGVVAGCVGVPDETARRCDRCVPGRSGGCVVRQYRPVHLAGSLRVHLCDSGSGGIHPWAVRQVCTAP